MVQKGHQITASEYPCHLPTGRSGRRKDQCYLATPNHLFAQTAAAGRASHVEHFRAFAHAWQGAGNEDPGLDGRIAEKQNQRSVLARIQEGGKGSHRPLSSIICSQLFPSDPAFFGAFGSALRSNGVVGLRTWRACPQVLGCNRVVWESVSSALEHL